MYKVQSHTRQSIFWYTDVLSLKDSWINESPYKYVTAYIRTRRFNRINRHPHYPFLMRYQISRNIPHTLRKKFLLPQDIKRGEYSLDQGHDVEPASLSHLLQLQIKLFIERYWTRLLSDSPLFVWRCPGTPYCKGVQRKTNQGAVKCHNSIVTMFVVRKLATDSAFYSPGRLRSG